MSRSCTVLTGTILPNLSSASAPDLKTRIGEYLRGFELYSTVLPGPIYFIENSSYPIEEDERLRDGLERYGIRLARYPPSASPGRGKGYQEFEMLDAWVLQHGRAFDTFMKVTGRYLFLNVADLIEESPRGIIIDQLRRRRVAITSLFQVTTDFYSAHIAGLYRDADDVSGRWIERVVYGRLREPDLARQSTLFARTPHLHARLGTGGTVRIDGGELVTRLRDTERRLLRRWNISELYV